MKIGWKEKLEKAIITGNMELVREYYEFYYDVEPPNCPDLIDAEEVERQVQERLSDVMDELQSIINRNTETEIEDDEDNDDDEEEVPVVKKSRTSKSKKNKKSKAPVKVSKKTSKKPKIGRVEQDEGYTNTIVEGVGHDNIDVKFVTGPTDEDKMKGYKKFSDRINKKKRTNYREPFQPDLRECDGCGDDFDFAKEYPAGLLEKSSRKMCKDCKKKLSSK